MKTIAKATSRLQTSRQRRLAVLLMIYAAISLVLFYSYIYNDILETTRMGMRFWEDLFDGRIRYFYNEFVPMDPIAYAKDVQGVYDFPIYLLFAVWDLPLYLLSHFASVDVFQSLGCMLWIKTMLLVFSVLFATALYRLARTVGLSEEMSLIVCILFYTSNIFMTSVVVLSAYDITALYFTISGVTCWLKKNTKGFVLCFMLAIPLKLFALLIFLPLLLLREKNIGKIIVYTVLAMSPILLCRILIPCSGAGAEFHITDMLHGTDLGNLALLYAITYHTDMVLGEIYYSVIGFGLLMAFCYFFCPKTQQQFTEWGIYVCFVSYAILFTTCVSHPYWIIIMTPFTVLLMAMNRRCMHINLVLDTIGTWGMLLAQLFYFPWCFGNAMVTNMFWPKLLGTKTFAQFNPVSLLPGSSDSEAIRKLSTGAKGMGSSVFLACILMMVALNCPIVQHRLSSHKECSTNNRNLLLHSDGTTENWLLALRAASSLVLGLLPLAMYVMWLAQ